MHFPIRRASATSVCLAVQRDTRPSCGGSGGSDNDEDDDGTLGPYADSGGGMGLEADAGTILKIAGDAGGCDDDSDSSVDGIMRIEEYAGGGDGDYVESGTSVADGMDLDLGGRDAFGSDDDGGEDGSMQYGSGGRRRGRFGSRGGRRWLSHTLDGNERSHIGERGPGEVDSD